MPGVLLALAFIVFGEDKGIHRAVSYVLVGAVAAAVERAVAAYFLGHARLLFEGAGFILIVPALYGAITGAIYWRFFGRNAGRQTAPSA